MGSYLDRLKLPSFPSESQIISFWLKKDDQPKKNSYMIYVCVSQIVR